MCKRIQTVLTAYSVLLWWPYDRAILDHIRHHCRVNKIKKNSNAADKAGFHTGFSVVGY